MRTVPRLWEEYPKHLPYNRGKARKTSVRVVVHAKHITYIKFQLHFSRFTKHNASSINNKDCQTYGVEIQSTYMSHQRLNMEKNVN